MTVLFTKQLMLLHVTKCYSYLYTTSGFYFYMWFCIPSLKVLLHCQNFPGKGTKAAKHKM
jgi:hypothetical protein